MDTLGRDFKASLSLPGKSSFKSASLLRRGLALIIDLFVINLVVFGPFKNLLINFFEGQNIMNIQKVPDNIYLAMFFITIMALLYFTLLQYYFQQTIGMMITKIQVVPDSGFFRILIRNLFIIPFFPFSLLWIIEPLYLFFKGRRLLEKLTNTNTVEVLNG